MQTIALTNYELESEKSISFTKGEWGHFIDEMKKQFTEENSIDIGRAIHNARYLANLDRAFADKKAGRGTVMTFEELERLINA